LQGGQNLK